MSIAPLTWLVAGGLIVPLALLDGLLVRHGRRLPRWTLLAGAIVPAVFGVPCGPTLLARQGVDADFLAAWLASCVLTLDHEFVVLLILASAPLSVPWRRIVLATLVVAVAGRALFAGGADVLALGWASLPAGVLVLGGAAMLFTRCETADEPIRPISAWWIMPSAIAVAVVFAASAVRTASTMLPAGAAVFAASGFALLGAGARLTMLRDLLDRIPGSGIGLAVIVSFVGVKLVIDAVLPTVLPATTGIVVLSVGVLVTTVAASMVFTPATRAGGLGRG